MKRYPWSCLACGAPNDASSDACQRCSCPAQASYKQIELRRNGFLASGEKLGPAALPFEEPRDLVTVAKVLLMPLGLLLNVWPFSKKGKK